MAILPKSKTPPGAKIEALNLLLYGPGKVGKSTFCSQAPDVLFIPTEPGLDHLEVHQMPVETWEQFCDLRKTLCSQPHGFKTVVIDTIDNLYRMCQEFICARLKINHPSDLAHAQAWGQINSEMLREIGHLVNCPKFGVYIISHVTDKEIESATKGKYIKAVPTIPKTVLDNVLAWVTMILFCDLKQVRGEDGKPKTIHIIKTKPSIKYEAGDRSGRLPDELPLDYAAFKAAYEQGDKNV